MSDQKSATLYRMFLPHHACSLGIRAKEMLEAAGYEVTITSSGRAKRSKHSRRNMASPQRRKSSSTESGSAAAMVSNVISSRLEHVVSKDVQKTQGFGRLAALASVVAVLGTSAMHGRRNAPDRSHPAIRRWYRQLDKPGFTPPDAVFGAVWPVLETGLAVGGYRLLRRGSTPARDTAVGLWLLNTAMIGGWTQLFFRGRLLGTSMVASGAMAAAGAAYVAAAAKVDRPAATLGVPLTAWLGFATILAERIWRDNSAEVQ